MLGNKLYLAEDTRIDDELRSKLKAAFQGMMTALYNEQGAHLRIDIITEQPAQQFIEAHANVLNSSFQQVVMSDAMRRRLTRSNYIFSGMKAFHEMNEAFPSILDENGNRKTFERFLNDVRKIDSTYNSNYLRAEYNFVQASAEMAAKWEQFMQDGDRYYLQYRTAKDDKVRPEHAALHGVTLPMSDTFWEEYYPPNGWNCFTKGTPVLTPEGWKPIESIRKGDSVIGGSGQFRIVIGTHAKTVNEKLVCIATKGAITTCTENHRFCTPDGWVTAACLKPGDIIIQVGENTTLHKLINAIGNANALLQHAFMTGIAQWKSIAALAVNNETKRGDVEVRNVNTEKMAGHEQKRPLGKVVAHLFFRLAQWCAKCAHTLGMKCASRFGTGYALLTDFQTEKGRGRFKLLRHTTNKFAVALVLALSHVPALLCKAVVNLRKTITCNNAAIGSRKPLRTNGIAAMTQRDTGSTQNARHCTGINTPMQRKPANTAMFRNITTFCGITEIHAFNGFNSFLDFLRQTFLHNRYVVVKDKSNNKKAETTVFNLSIHRDEAYVVPIGITHNCRCTVVQVRKSKHTPTPHDEAMALGEEALQKDPKGIFHFNAGKEQKTVPDYNPYTIRKCRDCDVAKGKLKLAFVPDNELCAACAILQKCAGDRTKTQRAIERTHYLHEMEPLLGKSVTKTAGDKSLNIGFTKYGNSHLFSDTFGRSRIMSKDDLKDLGDILDAASYIDDSPLTHPRTDGIEHFYYFKAQIRRQWIRLNVAKQVYRRPSGQIETRFFVYSINDI